MSCSEEQNIQPSPGGVNNNRKKRAEYRRKRTHLKQIVKKKEELNDAFMYSPTRLYGGGPQDIENGIYLEERKEFQQNLKKLDSCTQTMTDEAQ